MSPRDVVITGIGLVSSLGEGADHHWQVLTSGSAKPVIDAERFAPFTIHPLPAVDWTLQIPKRSDQRQMETWQRLGTYCAGLALDDAGMKGDDALCGTMDMICAAGGGERDVAVDTAILDASRTRNDRDLLLNERLTTDLRPTLFLAQLSNLLAGNISIVHKVAGSSRTFMGEEGSGETAFARIRSGQSTHALVGGGYQSEHPDMLLGWELGGFLHRGPYMPVWARSASEGGGVTGGSGAAFLVMESREHALRRGQKPHAELASVASSRLRRGHDDLPSGIQNLVSAVADHGPIDLVVSGASGAHEATDAERQALRTVPVRGFSTLTGSLKEAQFPFAVGLAALAVGHGGAFPPFDDSETAATAPVRRAVATAIGHHYFEGAALLAAA